MGTPTKILVHCPIARIEDDCLNSIHHLDVSGFAVNIFFTVYNTDPPQYSADGRETNPMWGHSLANKMNEARQIALDHGYDAILNIEHDMIVPPETIHVLAEYSLPDNCVCAAYRGRKLRNPQTPICVKTLDKKWPEWQDIKGLEKVPLWVIPFGCTMIGRKVLEQIKFTEGIDGFFASKTDELGIKKWLIPSVICGHIDRDGTVYWP